MTVSPHCDCHLLPERKSGGPQQQTRDAMAAVLRATGGWTGRWRGQKNGRAGIRCHFSGTFVLRLRRSERLKDEDDVSVQSQSRIVMTVSFFLSHQFFCLSIVRAIAEPNSQRVRQTTGVFIPQQSPSPCLGVRCFEMPQVRTGRLVRQKD